ncbi:MAG: hypothetical protein ACQESR_06300 [Planctomycetota bacterium]
MLSSPDTLICDLSSVVSAASIVGFRPLTLHWGSPILPWLPNRLDVVSSYIAVFAGSLLASD